jgi:hypothetical protein
MVMSVHNFWGEGRVRDIMCLFNLCPRKPICIWIGVELESSSLCLSTIMFVEVGVLQSF